MPDAKSQISPRLKLYILALIDLGLTSEAVSGLTGPDEGTVRAIRDARDARDASTPVFRRTEILGLDDWKHGKLRQLRAILVDVGNRMPIDLFETCRGLDTKVPAKVVRPAKGETKPKPGRVIVGLVNELKRYLAKHPEARVIVIDMSDTFRNLLRKHCPQLTIVVDHYHLKQLLENQMPKICDQLAHLEAEETASSDPLQGDFFEEESTLLTYDPRRPKLQEEKRLARRFKRNRKVSNEDPEGPIGREKECIKAWEATYPRLRDVLDRRDAFYRLWDSAQSSADGKVKFEEWVASITEMGPVVSKVFAGFIATVREWHEEIFAYFDVPERPTNAFTEAMVYMVKSWDAAGKHLSYPVIRYKFRRCVPQSQRIEMVSLRELVNAHLLERANRADGPPPAFAA